ncbi:MAG: aldo/keto reductase [Myxococcales bacterium]|nr:MAG: aldo/keto reductase [Myxococcales bacterium]
MLETRPLGTLQVTIVGLGCNNFGKRLDQAGTTAVVEAALDAGINFFDTADVYGGTRSEELLGKALGARRKDVLIATKFGIKLDEQRPGGASPAYLRRALEESLRRLGTDYVDLYQLHRPDPSVPIAETLDALNDLVRQGKVREIGSSNFSADQVREAARLVAPGHARFVSVQNEYSLLERGPERGVLAELAQHRVALLPYFPLASGLLSGKYRPGAYPKDGRLLNPDFNLGNRFLTPRNLKVVAALADFAEARRHTLLELAFSWLVANPTVASVIAGATSPEQVRANVQASSWRLTAAELGEVDALAPLPRLDAA